MSFGGGGSTQTVTTELSPEQRAQIQAQTEFFQQTVRPAYEGLLGTATGMYLNEEPGLRAAGQNLAGIAGQAQQVLGGTGESALRTGVAGLQNLFTPEFEAQQMAAALEPAQLQYQQNLADLRAGFGGAGQLGSARAALAQTGLAGQTQAQQQAIAAEIQKNIAAQRLAAGESLANLGQTGLGQAIGAAGQRVAAAEVPLGGLSSFANILYGTPSASYMPASFGGPARTTTSGRQFEAGIKIK